VRAGVLLLVVLPPAEDTDGLCEIELPGPGLLIWLLTALRVLDFDGNRLSLDNRVWSRLFRGVDKPNVDGVARLELLVGVAGTQTSSSGHPLNLLSYDLCVPDVELNIPVLARVGVLGESLLLYRRDGLGVASEGSAGGRLEMLPEELVGL
jgi:hypothetical protein